MTKMRSVLTIAGSDSSGGAGIQADIKTIESLGLFATSAITAITAQNTLGVRAVQDISPDIVEAQIDAVFEDIRPDAVKIGMVSSADIVEVIARTLRRHEAQHVVVDPVMVATSGSALIKTDAVAALEAQLFPLAQVLTPNIPEAEALAGMPITSTDDMVQAARVIAEKACPCAGTYDKAAVLVKGGHGVAAPDDASDFLLDEDGEEIWLEGQRIQNPNAHGTGCTLSSAIACGLARGLTVEEACREAKAYITGALRAGLDLGQGSGPLDHSWMLHA